MPELPRTVIEHDLQAALRAGDKEDLQTLRLLLTELKNKSIELGKEVDESDFHRIVQRSIKQRQESARQYREGNREELASKELREAAMLERYLPEQVGEAELREAARTFVTAQGLAGPAAMGAVMKEMMSRFGGRADGGTVNRIVRETLAATGE
jgi:uncharacterized protein YqeY